MQNLVPLVIRLKHTSEKDLEGEKLGSYRAKLANAQTDEEYMALGKDFLLTHALWSDDRLQVNMNA